MSDWLPINQNDKTDSDEMMLLFSLSARMAIKLDDPKSFLNWIADSGPMLAPGMTAAIDPRTGSAGLAFRAIGVQIYNAMPLPNANFQRSSIPTPGRNEPCSCGSGRKYKHCCLPLAGRLDLHNFNLLPFVLDALPKKIFVSLPDSAVDPEMVYDTALQWHEQGDPKRAIALLEPWFAAGRKLTDRLELMFDQLMNSYFELGLDRKRERLIAEIIARGDRGLRAAAMQRHATMLADQGDYDAAWQAFREAQREHPDDPFLAPLEATLLISRGEIEKARDRARFWTLRLERSGNPDFADLTDLMRKISVDPAAAMAGLGRAMNPDLDRLSELFENVPQPEVHYQIQGSNNAGILVPDRKLAEVESAWRKVFPQVKPGLTAIGHDDISVWDDAPAWLTILEHTPIAWQSFDILDDLVMAVDVLQLSGMDATLLEPLLNRGVMLLEANIAATAKRDQELPWGCLDNRPALRLLAYAVFRIQDQEQGGILGSRYIALAERLLSLNPHDNHGIRAELTRAWLANGEPEKALALSDRFPDDFCGMTLNRILALYRQDRHDDAMQVLADASGRYSVAIKMLLARNPKHLPMQPFTVSYGGKDEAWLYREAHYSLWEADGALEWLRSTWRKINKNKQGRTEYI